MGILEIQKILKEHEKWLVSPEEGTRADLRGTDLRWADLSGKLKAFMFGTSE